jgi:hypothetical protein
MHNNPCTGKWQLSENPLAYPQNSTQFYLTREQGIYPVKNFIEMEDVGFKNGIDTVTNATFWPAQRLG